MSSNLPPGVTENMIPGNRPEDEDEEKFWEAFFRKADEAGITGDLVDRGWVDDAIFVKAIQLARDLGFHEGFAHGLGDGSLATGYEHEQDA